MNGSVGRLVSILYRKQQVYLNGALKPFGLTASELPILSCLFGNDGVSQEDLSCFLSIDKASTARTVQSLVDKRFLAKEKDPSDRRANRILLTARALRQKEEIREVLQRWTRFLTEDFDEESLTVLFRLLEEMARKASTADLRELGKVDDEKNG